MIKPVSADCNLNCRYCYYRATDIAPGAPSKASHRMRNEVLEAVMRAYMQTPQPVHSMIWHGGEPTRLPASFYASAVSFQKQYARPGTHISNSIQTNGVRISAELARLMARYRFLCGVSMDGPAPMHDIYRRTRKGGPTHAKVLGGIRTLAQAGVPVNILVLVSRANVQAPLDVYRYLKRRGFTHIQFIPCIETHADGSLCEYAIRGEQWGDFLLSIFSEWFEKDIGRISIRLFESILAKLAFGTAIDCANSSACDRYLVVETNGDVYPCDFYVRPEYKLGNILETPFEKIIAGSQYENFSSEKANWHERCATCEFLLLCMGDCKKFRATVDMSNRPVSLLCKGWITFFGATLGRFQHLCESIRMGK